MYGRCILEESTDDREETEAHRGRTDETSDLRHDGHGGVVLAAHKAEEEEHCRADALVDPSLEVGPGGGSEHIIGETVTQASLYRGHL